MTPFLVMLDDLLPEKSGWKVLKYIRTISSRVIILTVCRRLNQKITRFDQGTDDYYEDRDRAVDQEMKRIRRTLQNWAIGAGDIYTLRELGYRFYVNEK
ncbi:hypothetical protein NW801_00190 [Brevibacillus laterosporus]|nr:MULTISPECIES: hypothetical protein [Brevibacillus]MCR8983493.1 hypothetical protein [Brevibacillus laterosporus]